MDGRNEGRTVREAAAELGITKEAVRKRIHRSTLNSYRDEDGTVRVYIPVGDAGGTASSTASTTSAETSEGRDELVEELRRQNDYLRGLLDQADTRDRENRRLLAAALERMPELEPPEARESSNSDGRADAEPAGRGNIPGDPHSATESRTARPWWRRIFGG